MASSIGKEVRENSRKGIVILKDREELANDSEQAYNLLKNAFINRRRKEE